MQRFLGIAVVLSLAFLTKATPSPIAEQPSPNNAAVYVGAKPLLIWQAGLETTTNLLANGSFEEGSTDWTLPTSARVERLSSAAHGTNVLTLASGTFSRIITLPQTNAPILASFAYSGPSFLSAPLPRILTPSGVLVKHIDLSMQGKRSGGWTVYSIDLSAFAGQTIQLAILVGNIPNRTQQFDDFRLITLPTGLEYDVYFQNIYKGRTSKPYLELDHRLEQGRTYRWFVDTIHNGATNKSPAWTFATYPGDVEPHSMPGFEPLPNPICPGQTVPITARYFGSLGFTFYNFGQTLSLAGAAAEDASEPTIVISEIDTGENDGVELLNVSSNTIDLTGWTLELINNTTNGALRLTFPGNALLAPGAIFTAIENQPTDTWPNLRIGNIDWRDEASMNGGAILRDNSSNIVDVVFINLNQYYSLDAQRFGAAPWDWLSISVTNRVTPGAYQRLGNRDNNTRNDWAPAEPNMKQLNPSMQIPFVRGYGKLEADFTVLTNKPGHFLIAEATFPRPASNATLFAQSGPTYVYGWSELFQVVPSANCLKLFAASEVTEALGNLPVKVTLGAAAPNDITVKLRLWETNRSEFLTNIVIPAGQSQLDIELPSFNNDLLQNTRTFALSASAPEYASDTVSINVLDDETATLTLTAAVIPIREGMFDIILESSRALDRDMPVRVEFHPSYWPLNLTFRAGTDRLAFGVPEDFRVQDDNPITVTAQITNWPAVSNTFPFVDNESKSITLIVHPDVLREGEIQEVTLKLGGTTTRPIDVTLASAAPDLVQAPATVHVDTGLAEVKFNLTTPINEREPSIHTTQIIASSPGFETTTNMVHIQTMTPAPILKAELVDGLLRISFDTEVGWEYAPLSTMIFDGTWKSENVNFGGPGRAEFTDHPVEPRRFYIIQRQQTTP